MIGFTIKLTSKSALQQMDQLSAPVKHQAKEAIGLLLISRAKENIASRQGPSGPWPSGPWSDLFGGPRTWRDVSASLVASSTDDGVLIGATHIAAAVRHFGTVGAGETMPDILPVKKKALTIPISQEASRASYQGKTAREAFPDAFLLTRDGRHGASPAFVGVIARKKGQRTNKTTGEKTGGTLELLYLLVGRVAIRPHPYLPVDNAGNIAPKDLENQIEQIIIDNFTSGERGVAA